MKKRIIYFIVLFAIVLLYSCNYDLYIAPRPGERLARFQHHRSDTVYVYNMKMEHKRKMKTVSYVWYHKNNHIHLYLLQEGRALRYKKIPAINYAVNDNITKYHTTYGFDKHIYGGCYDVWNKGQELYVYIKDGRDDYISVDMFCLEKKKCKEGTFEYKLQYDLSKVIPISWD